MESKLLSFLIVGETETIYEINPELVRDEKKEVAVNQAVYDFIEKDSMKTYHVTFSADNVDQYSFHVAKFSGDA